MGEKKVVNLSQPTEYKIRDKSYTVYPLSLEKIIDLNSEFEKLNKQGISVQQQATLVIDVVYKILKDSGNDVTKEAVKKTVTLEAGLQIMNKAIRGDMQLEFPSVT